MKVAIYTEALADYISGGILCIVELLNKLQERGHEVCAFVDHPPYTSNWIKASFDILPSNSEAFDKFDGVLVSPFSPTAKKVAFHSNASERLYWVHTNEALFTHNDEEWSQRAHDSYSLPIKMFATSHYVRILLEMQYRRRVIGTLVPPGVDVDTFNIDGREHLGDSSDRPVRALVFGRMDYCRGVDVAMNGLRLAQNMGIPLDVRAIPNGIRDRAKLADYYKWADIFIDPSRLAGSPTPPKEAMACGCVPIVTPYGTTDFVLHGENGYIVPSESHKAIAQAIYHYWNRGLSWKHDTTKENSRYIHTHFSWTHIAERFEAVVAEAELRGDELLEEKQW